MTAGDDGRGWREATPEERQAAADWIAGGRPRKGRPGLGHGAIACGDIREVVLARMDAIGWTRGRLADHPGITTAGRDAIYRWLDGRTELRAQTVSEVFRVLGIGMVIVGAAEEAQG